jgi:hypothetical protein
MGCNPFAQLQAVLRFLFEHGQEESFEAREYTPGAEKNSC